jgi:hypothetical protein
MKWTSRKFISAWVATGLVTVALFVGKLGGGEYVAALGIIWPSYFAANVGDKAVESKAKG